MEITFTILVLIIWWCVANHKKNKWHGIRDWDKWNYYKYHKGLSDKEMMDLYNNDFFKDEKATAEYLRKNNGRKY